MKTDLRPWLTAVLVGAACVAVAPPNFAKPLSGSEVPPKAAESNMEELERAHKEFKSYVDLITSALYRPYNPNEGKTCRELYTKTWCNYVLR